MTMYDEYPRYERDDVSDEIAFSAVSHLYLRYVKECERENLEPHSPHMWMVHGMPEGPLG